MGLHRFKPLPSGRMGILWTLSSIKGASLIEFGCMGHMFYSGKTLNQSGISDMCKLYSTHIDETDISLGNTDKLNYTVENVIKRDNPKVIFLLPSSIPQVIGTDLFALAKELQLDYPSIKFIPFSHGSFEVKGAEGVQEALFILGKKLSKPMKKSEKVTYNIIGSCADIFRFHEDAAEIERILKGAFGIEANCILTSNTNIEDIEALSKAHINIVLRQEGLKCAEYLKKEYSTEYVFFRPYGLNGTIEALKNLSKLIGKDINQEFLTNEINEVKLVLREVLPQFRHMSRSHKDEACISIGGHVDVVSGILDYVTKELMLIKNQVWCNNPLFATESIPYFEEERWVEVVKNHKDGFLMGSGEMLAWAKQDADLQIANPDTKWRLHRYLPPFVGFRGAQNIANLLINNRK